MKRLFAVIALIITLIGSADLCLAAELQIMQKASDWLTAAKLPSREVKGRSFSLLTEEEQLDLLTALTYVAGYKHGIFTGGSTGLAWGTDPVKVKKYIWDCSFVNGEVGNTYDWVRDYLIANPSERKKSTVMAFQGAFYKACGIKKE